MTRVKIGDKVEMNEKILKDLEDVLKKYGYRADILLIKRDSEEHYTITLGVYKKKTKEEDWVMKLGYCEVVE